MPLNAPPGLSLPAPEPERGPSTAAALDRLRSALVEAAEALDATADEIEARDVDPSLSLRCRLVADDLRVALDRDPPPRVEVPLSLPEAAALLATLAEVDDPRPAVRAVAERVETLVAGVDRRRRPR